MQIPITEQLEAPVLEPGSDKGVPRRERRIAEKNSTNYNSREHKDVPTDDSTTASNSNNPSTQSRRLGSGRH
ncbi:MAG TPA: hypothetical protein VGY77_12955 [Gemmataceae bacterium]|nr:hypothetical protein [Gemmataceae bacterium]